MAEDSTFMRVANAVGDLDSPLYDEERQRDVWNEASAVGFQAMLWSVLVAANVMIWAGGTAAIPYAWGTIMISTVGGALTMGYAQRSGLDTNDTRYWRRATPMLLLSLLYVAFAVGMLLAVDWGAGGLLAGMAQGAAAVYAPGSLIAVGVLLWVRFGRRSGDRHAG